MDLSGRETRRSLTARMNIDSAATNAGTAIMKNRLRGVNCAASRMPPITGPTIAPTRPTPSAQPTPVERTAVG